MPYLALATDYDGTLASRGTVEPDTLEALRRLAATGRKLILVTGRRVDDLVRVFPEDPSPGSACEDRKSTRLNSSHSQISYAVFCLKKKKKKKNNEDNNR